MDCIKSVDINASKPAHHVHILGEDIVVIKVLALNCTVLRTNLLAGLLVTATIDCVKQALGKVCASAKELHLFTNTHGADAASNCVVIAMIDAHKIVILVLDRAGGNRDLCAVALEAYRKLSRPQNSQVRLWAGTHVFKGVEPAEAGLGNHRAAINTNTTNGLSDPLRVSREELVVLRSTGKLDHTKLHNQVVNNLLNLRLSKRTTSKIALCIDVQEGGVATNGHCSAILLFNSCKVAQVKPLNRLFEVLSRTAQIKAVNLTKLLELLKSTNLLGELLTVTNGLLVHDGAGAIFLICLIGDKSVNTVESNATVVADDATATICVRQTGNDMGVTAFAHVLGVDIKNTSVVSLATIGVEVNNLWVNFITVGLACSHCHTNAAVYHQSALEGLVSLETNNLLKWFVNVASLVGGDSGNLFGVHIKYATVCGLLCKEIHNIRPKLCSSLSWTSEEGIITVIRGVILLNEVSDINSSLPVATDKAVPSLLCWCFLHNTLLFTRTMYISAFMLSVLSGAWPLSSLQIAILRLILTAGMSLDK